MSEEAHKISPLYDYPVLRIKESSIDLIGYMNIEYETECSRILMQRNSLKEVKIAVVFYEYK